MVEDGIEIILNVVVEGPMEIHMEVMVRVLF